MSDYECTLCKKQLDDCDAYEYRGAHSCDDCFDEVIEMRDLERNQIIQEESRKTKVFKGLDLTDSVIGKANKNLLKANIEIARNESQRLRDYEGG